jgi:hypothetical protein
VTFAAVVGVMILPNQTQMPMENFNSIRHTILIPNLLA